MKLFNEDFVLNKEFRVRVIDEINSDSNRARKQEAKKRYEVYKDNTVKYVMLKLRRELKNADTLTLMENRASNISIGRKIINKLARVYQVPPGRETGNPETNRQVSELSALLNFNSKQKKLDRFTRLFRTCMVWFYPDRVNDSEYRLCQKILGPHQYDVLSSPNDPEEAACVVLSEFIEDANQTVLVGGGPQVTHLESYRQDVAPSYINQGATVSRPTEKSKVYIWWTEKYHFTTDEKGEYIGVGTLTPEDKLNPIGVIPGVTSAQEQDGEYWAEGGQDIVDGSILVNTLLTDKNAILFMQGWGQLVITGKNIPQEFAVGPHKALVLTYDEAKGDPQPSVTSVSSNPPVADWRESIKQYVALLLSTNNLSPRTVSSTAEGSELPSGLAMLIDRSEATDSIEDSQAEFYWVELKEWEIIKRYFNLYHSKRLLTKDFMDIGALPEDMAVTPKFKTRVDEVRTEKDHLETLRMKKDLGLVDLIDMIMETNPGLTKEEAEKRALELKQKELEDVVEQKARQDEIPGNVSET